MWIIIAIIIHIACHVNLFGFRYRRRTKWFRNVDVITFASRRIDFGQVRSLHLPVRYEITKAEVIAGYFNVVEISYRAKMA